MIYRVLILTAAACSSFLLGTSFSFASTDQNVFVPAYCSELKEDNEYIQQMDDLLSQDIEYSEAFQTLQKTYISKISSIYNTAYKNAEKEREKKEQTQCDMSVLISSIQRSQIFQEAYKESEKYDCFLEQLEGSFQPTEGGFLINEIEKLKSKEQEVRAERKIAQKSIMVMDRNFGSYLETSPINKNHICLIKNISSFNTSLKLFVDNVIVLPKLFYNYGSTHQ